MSDVASLDASRSRGTLSRAWFVDAHTHGYAVALRNTAAVVVLGVALAVGLKWLDSRLPTIRR